MENFKTNEYFKDYNAIQKKYFSNLKQITEPKEVNGRLESIVLFNGEGYKKIEYIDDNRKYVIFVPKCNLQTLPVIEFTVTDDFINLEVYKIINKRLLEHTSYFSYFKEENEALAKLETKYFDVSDEINNKSYILKYGEELELGKGITKKLISKSNLFAKRKNKYTLYYNSESKVASTKETMPLFELLKMVKNQTKIKNKTK